MMPIKKLCLVLLFLPIAATASYGQAEQSPGTSPQPSPKPYEEKEFPQWLKDLRRAEVVMVGSFPFTIFLAIEIFDFYRLATHDFDMQYYAPWPLKGPDQLPFEEEEKINILITAVSLSICLAIADYIIVRIERGY